MEDMLKNMGSNPDDMLKNAGNDQEFLQLLKQYEASGGSLDPEKAPPELTQLLAEVQRQKQGSGSGTAPEQHAEGEDIKPKPGFVIKAHDDTGRKIFINVCGDQKIPAPGDWKEGKVPEQVKAALEDLAAQEEQGGGEPSANEALRFPLSCGDLLNDFDKKNEPCSVVDVILNEEVMIQSMGLRKLKVFVVELAMAWVGQKHKLVLDQKYKLPHLKYKGKDGPKSQRIRIDPKCLISEIDEPEDYEVSFPLVTKPLTQMARLPPEGLRKAAAATSATAPPPSPSSRALPSSLGPNGGITAGTSPNSDSEPAPKLGGFSFGGMLPNLHHKIFYEGTPVSEVVIEVNVLGRMSAKDVQVAVIHEAVEVGFLTLRYNYVTHAGGFSHFALQ
jgi:hypothetical protein